MVDAGCNQSYQLPSLLGSRMRPIHYFTGSLNRGYPCHQHQSIANASSHTASLTLGAINNHIIFSETTVIASAIVMLCPFGMFLAAPVDHLIGEPKDAVASRVLSLAM